MNDYETRRLEKIKKNQALLAELDIRPIIPKSRASFDGKPVAKKRKLFQDATPARTSARIAASSVRPSYNEDEISKPIPLPRSAKKAVKAHTAAPIEEPESLVPAKNVEEIQAGWKDWNAVASLPTRDDDRVFHFEDQPEFLPNKSPEEMLREGCFGGSYYRPLRSRETRDRCDE